MSTNKLKLEIQNLIQSQTDDKVLQEVLGFLNNASLNPDNQELFWSRELKKSIEKGKSDIKNGNTISLDDFTKNRSSWQSE